MGFCCLFVFFNLFYLILVAAGRSCFLLLSMNRGKKVGSNLDRLLTNLFIENKKGLLDTSAENKIQLQKIHDTKPHRENKLN